MGLGIFGYPQTHRILSCPKGPIQQQGWCCELVWGRAASLLFGFGFFLGVMSSLCEGCAAASSRKTNQAHGTWMSNARNKQICFFLFPLPLFRSKELSSWLYTTGISLIEKREWEKQSYFFSVLTIKFSKGTPSCLVGGWDVCFVPDANTGALHEFPSIPCFRDVLSFNITFLCF